MLGCEVGTAVPDAYVRADAGPVDTGPPPPRPDAGPRDAGPDAGCSGLTACEGGCVDVANDPLHCGACGEACEAPEDAVPVCAGSSCDFACVNGYARVGDDCLEAPRPIWPPSLSTVTSARPTFRFARPDGVGLIRVEVCADRACGTVLATIDAPTEDEAQPVSPLAAGVVYWRLTGSGRQGPTWSFRVGARTLDDVDRAWGVMPDYDGDGTADVAIGAPRADDSEGRAYVYLGGTGGTPSAPTSILRSPDGAAGEHGFALACAGDLDGDGYADLAVGAPRAGGTAGRVHVYLGGPSGVAPTPNVSLDAPGGAGSLFGGSLAGLGDVDGDGYGDLLVGAIGEGITPGRAYLYLGGPSGVSGSPDVTLTASGRFASSLAGAGDVDGDGLADAVVGAYQADGSAGAVHLFLGASGGLAAPAARVYAGDTAGGQLGFSVAGLGDVNGDGLADFAAGAPAVVGSIGRALVFHGVEGAPPDAPALTLDGNNGGGGFFGHAITGLGDGDGDGYGDVAISAFGVDGRRGRVSVMRGGPTGIDPLVARTQVLGLGTAHDFGWALAAGDVDGNGRADLVVGAPGAESRAGRAYVFRGGPTGVGTDPLVTLIGPSGGAFGRAVGHVTR